MFLLIVYYQKEGVSMAFLRSRSLPGSVRIRPDRVPMYSTGVLQSRTAGSFAQEDLTRFVYGDVDRQASDQTRIRSAG